MIDDFLPVTPVTASTYQALQITGTAISVPIAQAISMATTTVAAGGFGYDRSQIDTFADPSTGIAAWRFQLFKGDKVQIAHIGDWIVITDSVLTFYSNDDFTSKFNTGA